MEEYLDDVFRWLEENSDKRFFLFLHSYDVHDPFQPPAPFSEIFSSAYQGQLRGRSLDAELFRRVEGRAVEENRVYLNREDIDYIIAKYDAEIRYVDKCIGDLIDKLRKLGLLDETAVILTSDHGEELLDHGYIGHRDLYDEGIRVPLIIRFPPGLPSGKSVSHLVRSLDIAPTVLDLLGIESRDLPWQGKSLLPLALGEDSSHPAYAFSIGADNQRHHRFSIRTQKWKLISTPAKESYELYNLESDPDELINLVNIEKEQFDSLKQRLGDWLSWIKSAATTAEVQLDELTREKLKSLGYLQ
jgi:arylsulfatase A-like enzyme